LGVGAAPVTAMRGTDQPKGSRATPGSPIPSWRCPWPGAVAGLVLLGTAPGILLSPRLTAWLEFDRRAILGGELWRLFSGHLTHWTPGHLCWDLLACLLAVLLLLRHAPRTLLPLSLWSMLAVSLGILLAHPEIAAYRGLSGVDTALFAYLATALALAAARHRDAAGAGTGVLLLALIAGKILAEMASGSCLFVEADAFIPLPAAHLAGLLAGSLYALGQAVTGPALRRAPASCHPLSPRPGWPRGQRTRRGWAGQGSCP